MKLNKMLFGLMTIIGVVALTGCKKPVTPGEDSKDSVDVITGGENITEDAFDIDATLNETDSTISFGPRIDDYEGRVMTDGKNGEDLSLKLDILISGYHAYFSEVKIEITDAENGVLGKYVVVSDDTLTTIPIDSFEKNTESDIYVYRYTLDIKFAFSEFFNHMNPGDYYDVDEKGKLVSYEQMRTDLTEFSKAIENSKIKITAIAC